MKLLLCKSCQDVFKLHFQLKSCTCGKTRGKYLNNQDAVYSGNYAVPLGFANMSLVDAIINQPSSGEGTRFEAFVIPTQCSSFVYKDNISKE